VIKGGEMPNDWHKEIGVVVDIPPFSLRVMDNLVEKGSGTH
jgi:hypothetical protein